MKFDEDVWKKQIIPFVRTAFAEEKEYVSQLCKKDNKVSLGKMVKGEFGRVQYNVDDLKKCNDGEYLGTIHVETVQHKPTFPSDEDIQNEFQQVLNKNILEHGEELCLCSQWVEGNPTRGKHLIGCYCEKWTPWGEKGHKELLNKIYPYSYLWFDYKTNELRVPTDDSTRTQTGIGWFYVWDDLIDLGHVTDRQLQWYERQIFDGNVSEKGLFRHQKFPDKRGMETIKEYHMKRTGLPWRALDTHEKFLELVRQGKIGRKAVF
jgi:hypothetical protein